jgi:hypothetical protein
MVFKKQILGRVPGHDQLGEDDNPGPRMTGLSHTVDYEVGVPLDVPHSRIDLRQSDTHARP